MKYKYLFFDLDGTLTDPYEGIADSIAFALRKLGAKEEDIDMSVMGKYIGPPLVDSFADLGYGDRAHEGIGYYREYYVPKGMLECRLYDGVKEMLEALKDDFVITTATSKPEDFAVKVIDIFGILEFFDSICGASMDEKTRNHKVDVIRYAMEKYGAKPEECIMIGDRMYDIEGAKEAGIDSIGVLWGYGDRAELEKAGAEIICETPEDVVNTLKAL